MKQQCVCILFFLAFFLGMGQNMRRLSTNDGLPQSFVSGLVQDDEGFIWIATRNGLARYDGQEFKILQHHFDNKNSLASNIINWIRKDCNNNLWIEYESGEFDVLDLKTYEITHYITTSPKQYPVKPIRRGWLAGSDGTFWFIPRWGGIASCRSRQKIIRYNSIKNGLPSDTVKAVLEDSKKSIWVLSQKGISRFNSASARFVHFKNPYPQYFNTYPAGGEEMIALYERGNGELMWADRKNLFFFNTTNRSFRKSPLPEELREDVRWIGAGPDGREYFETGRKIFSFSDKAGVILHSTISYKKHEAKSFLVDRSGLLWIGTNADGVYQVDVSPGFTSYKYTEGFAEDVLSKQLGIDIHKVFDWKQADEGFLSAGYLLRSVHDKDNNLWLALKSTVCCYNIKQNRYLQLPQVPLKKGEWEFIKGIAINSKGEPVVVSHQGQVFTYSSASHKWNILPEHASIATSLGRSIQSQDIVSENDRIWITTTDNGLFYIDAKSRKVRQLRQEDNQILPSNQLLGIVQDPVKKNLLWIGTYQGLVCLDSKTFRSRIFTTSDGLPDNTIYSIVTDNNGFLWISTNKGLCRFNPKSLNIRVFSVSHGLQGNEFNRFHHLRMPDGKIAFGGPEGWSIFNPDAIKEDSFNPNVTITDIKINNNISKDGPHAKKLPNSIKKLLLNYNENTLHIAFAGMQFNQPEDLLYRYKLEGYDNGWILAGHRREAVYTKLPPGNYIFKVNTSNTSGKWSNRIKSLAVIVSPPWWQTWLAYGIYAILVVFMAWLFITYRIRQGILRREMLLKEKETLHLREVDEMKSKFFANITHELRTPLTLILSPLERLKHTTDRRDRNKLILTIKKNAGQLLELTNQLLDLARLEARAVKPQLIRGNPAMVISTAIDAFAEEAVNRNIALKFSKPQIEQEYWMTMEMLERIIYNLLSNALKFTPGGGKVEVVFKDNDNGIIIKIKDTGIGIPANRLNNIFDRFYRVNEEAGSHTGTGIGLSLVKELVDVQGGSIEVRSYIEGNEVKHASGTVFTVFLPYNKIESTKEIVVGTEALNYSADATLPLLLLVEDNIELAKFITGSLEQQCRIIHSPDGDSGLQTALNVVPDLIISDVLMPGKDGFMLCAELKQDNRTNHIPVILLTAKTGFDSRMKGLSLGADDYITKPFHVEELNLKINNQLENQKKLRAHIQKSLRIPEPIAISTLPAENILQDNFLSMVYTLIEENIDDPAFKVEELAESLGMSRTSLHRKIKGLTDISAGEVINAYRLKKAAAMLPGHYTIAEVAFKTGFATPAYFSKCFRELYSITPTEYIKRARLMVQ